MCTPIFNTQSNCFDAIKKEIHQREGDKKKIDRARQRLVAIEGGFSYLPGITNIVLAPLWLYSDTKETVSALLDGDSEGARDTSIRLAQHALAFFSSAATVLDYENAVFHNIPNPFPNVIPVEKLGLAGGILGLILCVFELAIECLGFGRQVNFRNSPWMHFAGFLEKHRKTIETEPHRFAKELRGELPRLLEHLTPEEKEQFDYLLSQLDQSSLKSLSEMCGKELYQFSMAALTRGFAAKYFPENDNGERRLSLERKVGIETCKNLDIKFQSLSEKLDRISLYDNESVDEAGKVFKVLDDQALKKQIVHILGICAAVLVGAALVGAFFSGYGTAGVLALFILGTLFSFARYMYLHGMYNHIGWDFRVNDCLPTFLQSTVSKTELQRQAHLAA